MSESRDFIPAFLANGFNLSIGLVVNRFGFAMPMRQDAIQLLRLLRRQPISSWSFRPRDSHAAPVR